MKIFRSVQTNFKSIGICAERISFGLYEFERMFAYIFAILSCSMYIVHMAKTAKEYIESISKMGLVILLLFSYLCFRYNSQVIFKLMDDLVQAINKSE